MTPDGVVSEHLEHEKPGVLLTDVDTALSFHDGGQRWWRERVAKHGVLHSGTLVSDPRSDARDQLQIFQLFYFSLHFILKLHVHQDTPHRLILFIRSLQLPVSMFIPLPRYVALSTCFDGVPSLECMWAWPFIGM